MKKQVKQLVCLLLSLMFLATTMLSLSGPASADPVPLQNVNQGSTVSFAGYQWIVLDPSTGFLLMKSSYGQDKLFDSDGNLSIVTFDPKSSTNIAYYLNTAFYNSLPSADQALIASNSWTNADETEDTNTSSTVNCKIGLISYTEFNKYTNNGSNSSIISNLGYENLWWTRTPYSANSTNIWEVNGNGMGYAPADGFDLGPLAVRPALYLESGLTVSGGVVSNEAISLLVPVTGVTLNKNSDNILVGQSDQLTATIDPVNADNTSVAWTSSDTSVATVDQNGLVKVPGNATPGGTATITVTTQEGSYKATCNVEACTPYIEVNGLTLSKNTDVIDVGATDQLTATISPSNADDKKVTWSTDDGSVATVSSKGLVKGVGVGSTTIMVITDDNSYYQKCVLNVVSSLSLLGQPKLFTGVSGLSNLLGSGSAAVAVTGVAINPGALSLTVSGPTATITATVTPSNATNPALTWVSDTPSVATVDQNGVVTGAAAGTAHIIAAAQDGSNVTSAPCVVTVTTATASGGSGTTSSTTVTSPTTGTSSSTSGTASSTAGQIVLQFTIGSTNYTVNGQTQTMDTAPVITDGRTLLPIRYVATPLGATASWDQAQQMVTVAMGSKTIQLVIGQNSATVNGAATPIDSTNPAVTPVIVAGRTMLPLRFIAGSLGCQVNWNAAQQLVTVTYPQ